MYGVPCVSHHRVNYLQRRNYTIQILYRYFHGYGATTRKHSSRKKKRKAINLLHALGVVEAEESDRVSRNRVMQGKQGRLSLKKA
jgi:hypothetical protein